MYEKNTHNKLFRCYLRFYPKIIGVRMKILIINSFDKTGGSTVRMRRFYNFFCDLYYDVTYIESNSELSGKNIISVRQKNTLFGFFVGTIKRMFLLMKLKYDVLFIQKLAPFTVPIILIAKLCRKKIIVDFDDWDSMLQRSHVMKFLCSLSENLFFNLPDAFTTPHESLRLLLKRKTNKKVYVIPQGIDTDLFCYRKYNKSSLRKKFNLPEEGKIVGFLGCFTPAGVGEFKNILLSMKKIVKENSNVFFVVIGGGRLLDYYKNLCLRDDIKNVIFVGHVPHEKVPEYIAVCDVMTIWMRNEIGDFYKGTLKILEYLSMNKPVVGYLVGETKKSFGKYCIECLPNVDSFAEQIKSSLEKIEEKVSFYEFIREKYSLDIGKNLLKEIIETLYEGTTCKSTI